MRRLTGSSRLAGPARRRRGYTIVELLVATTLTLILLGMVAVIFGAVSRSVHQSRAVLEMTSRLRAAKARLELDLEGVTALMVPPRRPEGGEGYFEFREGPIGPWIPPHLVARDTDRPRPPDAVDPVPYEPDATVVDFDDVLMFTSRSRKGPYVGRYRDTTLQSEEAEIIWFLRGRTLYRRLLLVAPQRMSDLDNNRDSNSDPTDYNGVIDSVDLTDAAGATHAFHEWYDLSARPEVDPTGTTAGLAIRPGWGWVLNSLGDLTKRENRYAHRVHPIDSFPFSMSRWGQLGLPTLRESAHPDWMTWANAAGMPAVTPIDVAADPTRPFDLWNEPHPWPEVDPVTGTLAAFQGTGMGERVAEDVILTNVIGFDVKVWDPKAPVLRAIRNDGGTPASAPADLMDDPTSDSVLLTPGDPGYPNALAHFWVAWSYPPATRPPAYRRYLPPGSDPYGRSGAWGAYVDLNYAAYAAAEYASIGVVPTYQSDFSGPNHARSQLTLAPVYDTWSLHYENNAAWIDLNGNGVFDTGEQFGDEDGDGLVDEGTDGFDNGNGIDDDGDGMIDEDGWNGLDDDGDGQVDEDDTYKNGIVDDGPDVDLDGDGLYTSPGEMGEWETMPPYFAPLRGIQVEIRTFEPDSRQVRTVTLVMDFVTK